jgi:NADH:ubiquinone oxidoreductase subunit 5 (subunit L)/multisubunit Na+/H+ antiporter MnhA subunit
MSQLGLMFAGLGSGSLLAGVLLLIAQALYKAPLFLAAGAIDRAVGGTSFDRMGGLARRMPFTLVVFGVAAAALAGLPVTLALPAKDPLIAAAREAGAGLFIATLAASFVTALYSGRILGLVFWGRPPEAARRAHEAPMGLLAPMIAFVGAMVLGLAADSSVFAGPLGRLLGLEATQSFATNAIAMAIAAIGFASGLTARRLWPDQVIWPTLQAIAPIISEAVAMNRLYRAFAAIGLRGAHLLAALDRRVFDRIAQTVARISVPAVRRLAALDHRVFDAAARSGASWGLALVRGAIRIDVAAVERSFAAFGDGVLATSQRLRRLQTGRVENYLMTIFVWSLAIALLVVAS